MASPTSAAPAPIAKGSARPSTSTPAALKPSTGRDDLRDVDKRDTRILIQTHPDVLVIPPDPPQLLIKIGQVRVLTREIYRLPAEARRSFSSSPAPPS